MITPARTAAVPILSRSCGLTGCGRSIGQLSDKDMVPLQLHPCAADRPTSSIGQPRYDNGVMQSLVHALIKLIPGVTTTAITSGRAIPALSAIYLFWTFGASGALSAAGQAMGREEGLDIEHSRKHIHKLDGLPLRLRSAHYALMENFPGKLMVEEGCQIRQ
ncbi:hypothetical protein IG631_13452 [Alternaria alternata]|nr:hypothetical protein IG631_13452 [Alternaria alternata]